MGIPILAVYVFCLLCILAYSIAQGHLVFRYLRSKKTPSSVPELPEKLPYVTVQLPVYNEPLVVERLIRKVAEFDYPRELLEIQVLDDSTDMTVDISSRTVAELRGQGLDIHHVRRSGRKGFKAGALAHGTDICKGEFIAIFDADFLPESDFLKKTIGHFADAGTGAVQVRWGHLNRNYNLLTRLLAITLDAHFTIEQHGRNAGGDFINFNGTAGIWRKACITDAGGWSADTLTEDLDLSYRAQMKGWHLHYMEEYSAPAEIPMLMPAIRSQQYRWNKGGAEVARKQLGKLLSSDLPLHTRLHGMFHLLNTAVFLCVLTAALVSVPLLFWMEANTLRDTFLAVGMGLFAGFFILSLFYWVSIRRRAADGGQAIRQFLFQFPMFLCVSMGLSLFNSIAVLEGYMGRRTPFVRTPKFASIGTDAQDSNVRWGFPPAIAWAEAMLALYFIFGIVMAVRMDYFPFLLFHLMLAVGFSVLFGYSVRHARVG